jgi:hypothetical protein
VNRRDLETAAARYGRLTPSTRQRARARAAVAVGVALMLGAASVLRSHAAWSLDRPVNAIAVCFALSGAALVVSGIFDHRLLVQAFGSPSALDHENGDVAAR